MRVFRYSVVYLMMLFGFLLSDHWLDGYSTRETAATISVHIPSLHSAIALVTLGLRLHQVATHGDWVRA